MSSLSTAAGNKKKAKMTKRNTQKFAIVVDSGSDLPHNFYNEHQVILVPFHIRLGEDDLLDVPEAMPEDFYVRFSSRRERVRTSQPSLAEYEEVYQTLIDEGYSNIISLHMSSELSGSYQTALNASASFEDSNVSIEVVDTKLASGAQGMIVADLVAMRDDGVSFEEALAHVQNMMSVTKLYFIPTQKDALSIRKKFDRGIFSRIHKIRDDMFGTRFLDCLDEDGALRTVTGAKDLSEACAQLARTMSKDAKHLGHLIYVEMHAGTPHTLSYIEKPLDTNEFSSQCVGVLEASPAISCYAGVGSIGIAYVPKDVLYNSDFTAAEAWKTK